MPDAKVLVSDGCDSDDQALSRLFAWDSRVEEQLAEKRNGQSSSRHFNLEY